MTGFLPRGMDALDATLTRVLYLHLRRQCGHRGVEAISRAFSLVASSGGGTTGIEAAAPYSSDRHQAGHGPVRGNAAAAVQAAADLLYHK